MHVPVLLEEVISLLAPQSGEFFIDGTFGGGGHSQAILERIGPAGKLLAIDWNAAAIEEGKKKFSNLPMIWHNGNFAELPNIIAEHHLPSANGILLDLGVSSNELEHSGRGFSFQREEPLIMTYHDEQKPVSQILRELHEKELAEVIRVYGEERYAEQIARAIKETMRRQPLRTSRQLAECIAGAVPSAYERGRIHPATRTFQALRIYANRELENLRHALRSLPRVLHPGGRAAVISFHSLEDRIVKEEFRALHADGKGMLLTKKPVTAADEEIAANPRARSAKLRGIKIF